MLPLRSHNMKAGGNIGAETWKSLLSCVFLKVIRIVLSVFAVRYDFLFLQNKAGC